GDRIENRGKAGHPVSITGGKVGSTEEGLLLGRKKYGERPAPGTPHDLHDELVNVIEIRTLFAIDFDANEELVHARGDRLVLERLALHHVAPVARRVTNRQKDRLVLGLGSPER